MRPLASCARGQLPPLLCHPSLLRLGTIQGMCADVRRDVLIQRSTTIEALRTAADIADASTRAGGGARLTTRRRLRHDRTHVRAACSPALHASYDDQRTHGADCRHWRPTSIDDHRRNRALIQFVAPDPAGHQVTRGGRDAIGAPGRRTRTM